MKENKIFGHFLRDPKTGLFWLNNYSYDPENETLKNLAKLNLAKCQHLDAEIVSGKFCYISDSTIELLVTRNEKGNYAVLTLFFDSIGFGGIYVSITPGFTFKSVYCFNEDCDIYIVGEDLEGNWGVMRVSLNSTPSPWRPPGLFTPNEIVGFKYEQMDDALKWCQAAARAKKKGMLVDLSKPTEEMRDFIEDGGSWGTPMR